MERYKCKCQNDFKTRSGLSKHRKKCRIAIEERSNIDEGSRESDICACLNENCDFKVKYVGELREHLEKEHQIPMETEIIQFDNYEDFRQWKLDYEESTTTFYLKKRFLKTESGRTEYFYCNRSGKYKPSSSGATKTRKRKLKAQGSSKMNANCTSAIKMEYLKACQTVRAYICHSHYGHEKELDHIALPEMRKKELAAQLLLGITPDDILRNIRSRNVADDSKLERVHLTNKRDLLNIKKAYGINCIIDKEEDVSESLIESHLKDILLYKRRNEENITFPLNFEHDLNKDDFALVIMNTRQIECMQKYGNNLICVDCGTTPFEENQFNLMTIFVIDDVNEEAAAPVAWFVINKLNLTILKACLNAIKNNVGLIKAKLFLAPKCAVYYEAWETVFGETAETLFNPWHVHFEWKKELNKMINQETASEVYKSLCLLVEEIDGAAFNVLLRKVIEDLKDTDRAEGFDEYFETNWLNCINQWATCYRINLGLKYDINLEIFDENFSYFYKGKRIKRIDKCLVDLLEFIKNRKVKRKKLKTKRKSNEIKKRKFSREDVDNPEKIFSDPENNRISLLGVDRVANRILLPIDEQLNVSLVVQNEVLEVQNEARINDNLVVSLQAQNDVLNVSLGVQNEALFDDKLDVSLEVRNEVLNVSLEVQNEAQINEILLNNSISNVVRIDDHIHIVKLISPTLEKCQEIITKHFDVDDRKDNEEMRIKTENQLQIEENVALNVQEENCVPIDREIELETSCNVKLFQSQTIKLFNSLCKRIENCENKQILQCFYSDAEKMHAKMDVEQL